jgi:hypothetical protein
MATTPYVFSDMAGFVSVIDRACQMFLIALFSKLYTLCSMRKRSGRGTIRRVLEVLGIALEFMKGGNPKGSPD